MLETTSPSEGINLYLDDRENELSDQTKRKYGYQLDTFKKWCEAENLNNLNDLTGRKMQQFKQWRGSQVKPITLQNNLWTVKNLIQFCEHINAVPEGVHRKIRIPDVSDDQQVKKNHLSKEEADAIIEYLDKYEYASLRHAVFITLWKTGMRTGTLHGLDIDDLDIPRSSLKIRHRPETGTPLKNKHRAERMIHLQDSVTTVLDDYIETNHPKKEDDHGRIPLFMGRNTRAEKTTIQRNIYTATRPCHYTNSCPHGRSIDTCEAVTYNTASKCPSSCGPHALRKGYVTEALKTGQAPDVTGERTNMSRETLSKHYDQRTEGEQMDARKRHLNDI